MPAQDVALAQELRDEQRLGLLVEPARLGDLAELAGAEHGDAIGHGHRLDLVVRDIDHGDAEPRVQVLQLVLHLLAQLAVERAQRLVEQHQPRLEHQRARHRDPLLLATGELLRRRSARPSSRTMESARLTFGVDLRAPACGAP